MTTLTCSSQLGFYKISLSGTKAWLEVSFNPLTMEIILWRKHNSCNTNPMPEKHTYKEYLRIIGLDKEFNLDYYEQNIKIVKRINSKLKTGKW